MQLFQSVEVLDSGKLGLKEWRNEMAHKMVFGAEAAGETPEQIPLCSII